MDAAGDQDGAMMIMTDRSRVLVIDDDPFMRQLVEAHLTRAGLAVDMASGGEDGVARAQAGMPSAIILDFAMPGMSGQAVLQRLRRDPRTAAIPVIVLSAWSSGEDKDRALAQGATWLDKPIEAEVLVAAVERLIRSRAGAGAHAARP